MGFFWIVGIFISGICGSYSKVTITTITRDIRWLNLHYMPDPILSVFYGLFHSTLTTTFWKGINMISILQMKVLRLKDIVRDLFKFTQQTIDKVGNQIEAINGHPSQQPKWKHQSRKQALLVAEGIFFYFLFFWTPVRSPCSTVMNNWARVVL